MINGPLMPTMSLCWSFCVLGNTDWIFKVRLTFEGLFGKDALLSAGAAMVPDKLLWWELFSFLWLCFTVGVLVYGSMWELLMQRPRKPWVSEFTEEGLHIDGSDVTVLNRGGALPFFTCKPIPGRKNSESCSSVRLLWTSLDGARDLSVLLLRGFHVRGL